MEKDRLEVRHIAGWLAAPGPGSSAKCFALGLPEARRLDHMPRAFLALGHHRGVSRGGRYRGLALAQAAAAQGHAPRGVVGWARAPILAR